MRQINMSCTAGGNALSMNGMRFLISVLFLLNPSFAFSDEVTLHFIKAPLKTNWKSPRSLALSTLKNQIAHVPGGKRHEIGHVYAELRCGDQHAYSGVTSLNNTEERSAIFKEGYGLGVLLKNYSGKFDSPAEIEADLKAMFESGRSNFIRFSISPSTCGRLMTYLSEYERLGYQNTYAGLNARPLLRQGSGCSAYGMSFLELAGLQVPEFEQNWMTHRILPRKLVGGPLTGRRVSVLKILTQLKSRWDADLSGQGFAVHFWDPEKMHRWVELAASDLTTNANRVFPWPAHLVRIEQSVGIELDATQVPTPTGPFFQDLPPSESEPFTPPIAENLVHF